MYLIDIRKIDETDAYADYAFSSSEAATPGVLRIEKSTGRTVQISPISGGQIGDPTMGPWRDPEAYFSRAARQVSQAWKRGELPKALMWAS